jgi:hypothetical protein
MAIKTRASAKPALKTAKSAKAAKVAHAAKASKPSLKISKPVKKSAEPIRPTVSGASKSAKQGDLLELDDKQVTEVIESQNAQTPQEGQSISGRGVFAVRSLGDAVSVEAAFLVEDGNVLRLPAVFPNREYAMGQIEELRQIVNQHFDAIEASK